MIHNITAILLLVSLFNGCVLYFHQWNSDYWLPQTEDGQWRTMSSREFLEYEYTNKAEKLGITNEKDLSVEQKKEIIKSVNDMYPKEVLMRMYRRDSFHGYLSNFGLFQFPLTILSLLSSTISIFYSKDKIYLLSVPAFRVSAVLFIDSFYRKYFGSLGW